jgi:hypothetical protein
MNFSLRHDVSKPDSHKIDIQSQVPMDSFKMRVMAVTMTTYSVSRVMSVKEIATSHMAQNSIRTGDGSMALLS